MKNLSINNIVQRSLEIRRKYHALEEEHHGSRWSVEEDALAFLTDAGLVGRLTMSHQGRWPANDKDLSQLKHKLGEGIWWLIVLAERMDLNIAEEVDGFLRRTEARLAGES
jgi:hypothetical protein